MTKRTKATRAPESPAAQLMALVLTRLSEKLQAGDCTTGDLLKLLQHLQKDVPAPDAPPERDLRIVLVDDD